MQNVISDESLLSCYEVNSEEVPSRNLKQEEQKNKANEGGTPPKASPLLTNVKAEVVAAAGLA